MVKIWRVENQNGLGCYSFGEIPFIKRMIKRHNKNREYNPLPCDDIGIERDIEEGSEICGFKDKQQALNWFNKYELKQLAFLGFFLEEIEVTAITAIGQRQILAVR